MNPTDDCIRNTFYVTTYSKCFSLFINVTEAYSVGDLKPSYTCNNCIHQFAHKLTGECEAEYETQTN